MSHFYVEFGPKVEKDLRHLKDNRESCRLIDQIQKELSVSPWPFGKLKKKIHGISYVLYRLRIDTHRDSYRIFYTVEENKVFVLRIVSKKEADRIINSLK